MFFNQTKKFATGVLATMACIGAPMHLAAEWRASAQVAQSQSVPARPSADVSLPATQPTAVADATSLRGTEPTAQKLYVQFIDGKIIVDATNASLSRVVDDIAAKAEIKVTGSVSEERVFGHYGPAAPGVILGTLLDGTGSNMLLIDDANGKSELILTPRIGGATPPNPLAAALDRATEQQDDDRPIPRFGPGNRPFQPGQGRGPTVVPPNIGSQFQTGARPGGPSSFLPANDSPDPAQTPSDPRTTQQIYDQLQNQKSTPAPPQ